MFGAKRTRECFQQSHSRELIEEEKTSPYCFNEYERVKCTFVLLRRKLLKNYSASASNNREKKVTLYDCEISCQNYDHIDDRRRLRRPMSHG